MDRLTDVLQSLGRPLAVAALNAGRGAHGRFDEIPLDDDLRVVQLNVVSTVHLAKLVVRDMVAHGGGRLLITSSIAATGPGPYHATYAASKAFGHSFAEALRAELAETGVVVTSLMPGPTDTEFFERADMQDTGVATGHLDDPADVARDGLEALFAGKDKVVAGARRNRVQAAASTVLPDTVAAKAQQRQTAPGSGSH
jgi:short-subunit dehydrogenase